MNPGLTKTLVLPLTLAELQTKPARPKNIFIKKVQPPNHNQLSVPSSKCSCERLINFLSCSPCSPHSTKGRHRQCSWKGFQGNVSKTSIPPQELWGSKTWFHISKDAGHTTDRSSDTEACKALEPVGSKMLHRFFLEKKQGYLLPSLEFSEWQAFCCTFLENVSTLRNVSERAYTRHVSRNRGAHTHTQPPLAFSD